MNIKIGETLIKKGKRLDYADLGIMASSGISEVLVYKKPRVSIISTGDEVCDINSTLKPGKIYDSNLYSLSARIEELGYNVLSMEHVGDNILKIGEAIEKAFEKSDIVFTTGGASVGEKDLMQKVSESIGFEKLFWKIKIKPGSAVVCSKKEEKILISLSGNPNAALTTFELLGKPVLKKLEGEEENINIKREKGVLMDSFNKKSPQRRFLRGNVIYDQKGAKVYITQIKSGNGILSSLLNANCLIEIEKGNEDAKLTKILFDAQKGVCSLDRESNMIELAKGVSMRAGKGVYPQDLDKEEFHKLPEHLLKQRQHGLLY